MADKLQVECVPATTHEAMCGVMDEVQGISKKSRNESQNFNFRGIDAVMNAVGPAFRKYGIVATPHVLHHEMQAVEVGKNRTPMNHVVVHVAYEFNGPTGDTLTAEVLGEAMDSGDKAISKAMSVAYRTALLQVLTIPTDEPDPDESSYERSASDKPKAEPKPAKSDPLAASWDALVKLADIGGHKKAVFEALGHPKTTEAAFAAYKAMGVKQRDALEAIARGDVREES